MTQAVQCKPLVIPRHDFFGLQQTQTCTPLNFWKKYLFALCKRNYKSGLRWAVHESIWCSHVLEHRRHAKWQGFLMVCLHLTDQISAKSQTQGTLYTRQAPTHVGFTILLSDLIDGMLCIRRWWFTVPFQ